MTTSRDIIARVAAEYDMTPADLTQTRSRHPRVMEARRRAMAEIRDALHLSTTQIGRLFNRSHATVIFNLRKEHGGTKFGAREGNENG